ncbi:hypothetical protein U1Q18_041948 [Sarracenia purpurea var. burkii]
MGDTFDDLGSRKNSQVKQVTSVNTNKSFPKRRLVASSPKSFSEKFARQVGSFNRSRMGRGTAHDAALFLLKIAALETVRRFSRARCPFVWCAIQALQFLCYPPLKWIQRWVPIKGLVNCLQLSATQISVRGCRSLCSWLSIVVGGLPIGYLDLLGFAELAIVHCCRGLLAWFRSLPVRFFSLAAGWGASPVHPILLPPVNGPTSNRVEIQKLQLSTLSRPLLVLSIATAFSDQPGCSNITSDAIDDSNVPNDSQSSSESNSDLRSVQSTLDIRILDEIPQSQSSTNWLFQLYEELEKQGINLPER